MSISPPRYDLTVDSLHGTSKIDITTVVSMQESPTGNWTRWHSTELMRQYLEKEIERLKTENELLKAWYPKET